MNYRPVILFILLSCFATRGKAQYNDSIFYHFNAVASGSVNKTNDVSNYLLNNKLGFGIKQKSISFNLSNSWVYGRQQKAITNNDYTGVLDFNLYKTFDHFYYWGLGTYTTSLSLKINNQYQYGLGIAYNILDTANAYLNISNGIIYENSDIIVADTTREVYNTFRNSFRLSFRFKVKKIFTISGIGFLQNSLQYKNDYILKVNLSASVKLKKWLSFTSGLTFNQISRTERENFLFTYGITIDNYF